MKNYDDFKKEGIDDELDSTINAVLEDSFIEDEDLDLDDEDEDDWEEIDLTDDDEDEED